MIAACCAIVLLGCGIEFDVEIDSETVIERGTLLEQFLPVVFDQFVAIELSETEEFQNRDVNPRLIDSVRMTSFILDVVDPEDGDLSFLRALEFFVEAEGLPRERVAFAPEGAFAAGASRIELDLEDVELKPYATGDQFSLTTNVRASRRPLADTTVRAEVVLKVVAGL